MGVSVAEDECVIASLPGVPVVRGGDVIREGDAAFCR